MSKAIRAIRATVLSDPDLAALLQRGNTYAIRAGEASEIDVTPYVLLWRIIDRPIYQLGGRTGVFNALVQVDCYAATKGDAYSLAAAIADALDGMRGTVDGDIWVSQLIQEDSRDRDERIADGADRPLSVVQTDYRLVYR